MSAKHLLTSLLVSVAVVVVYHLFLSAGAKPSEPSTAEGRTHDPDASARALEEEPATPPEDVTLAGQGEEPEGPTVEERLAMLEEQVREVAERLKPPEAGSPSPLIEAAEARAREAVRERELGLRRQEVRRLEPDLAENDVSEVARLLSDYGQAVRDLYEGKENVDEAERGLLRERYEALSRTLEADLGRYLTPEHARRLAGGTQSMDSADGR